MLYVLIIINALWLPQTNRQTNLNFNEVFPFQLMQELDKLIANVMQSKNKRDWGHRKITKVSCPLDAPLLWKSIV